MSKEIAVQLSIGNTEIKTFQSLSISQQFNAHHRFELVLDEDNLYDPSGKSIADRYIGKAFAASFGQTNTTDAVFKGIVTELSHRQSNGLWGSLVLKGYSPTYLLEGGDHHHSFYKKHLNDIVSEVVGNASVGLSLENNPTYKADIPYMSQYGESHFGFLNRLSAEYGEWLYYNGEKLLFGRPSEQEVVQLLYGSDLSAMDFSVKVVPAKVNHYSYNSQDDTTLTASLPEKINGIGSFATQALKISDELYAQPVSQPVAVRTSDMSQLDQYVKKQKEKLAASTVSLKAEGDNPLAQIGRIAQIKVLKKEGKATDLEEYGEFLITSITHYLSGTGAYHHTFEGIPSMNEQIPFSAPKPVAETQIATVKDNKDPKNVGRVRVQMLWQEEKGELTDWLRVLTPDAGGNDNVKQNRGFVFIPEVGDQVAVGFRYNDPNRPFVLGSLFHGKTGGGGSADNQNKSLTTRTGSTLLLNDVAHTITLQTSKGNTIKVDEKSGAVTISSGSTVTISSGSSISLNSKKITLTGEEEVIIKSPKISVGTAESDTVEIKAKETTVGGENKLTNTSKELLIDGTTSTTIKGKKLDMSGSEATLSSGKTQIH